MNDRLEALHTQLRAWHAEAVADGWLDADSIASLQGSLALSPDDLFDGPQRPLVVGLFGGTGVGKSSLLNRIAGEAVAEASAARPTSTRVTLYAHTAMRLASLPEDLPVDRVETRRHGNAHWNGVLWIDMPDVDSAETGHRDIAVRWLPHLDLVLYVMSPDRYRDDRGWRLLRDNGYLHAWIFVLNQWDRGDPVQRDDLAQRLASAGFSDPVIYCTDSRPDIDDTARVQDQFEALAQQVQSLAQERLLSQLDARGIVQRVQATHRQAEHWLSAMGSPERLASLPDRWRDAHRRQAREWRRSADWKLALLARPWQDAEPGWLGRTLALVRGGGQRETERSDPLDSVDTALRETLLDDGFQLELATQRARFVQDLAHEGLQAPALGTALQDALRTVDDDAPDLIVEAVQRSLAQPGTPLQRSLTRMLGVLSTLLPLGVFGWVGYRLVVMFQAGGSEPARYLGSNFALHSLMLLVLAWAVPAFLRARIRPRPARAALRGLEDGLMRWFEQRSEAGAAALQQAVGAHTLHYRQLAAILGENGAGAPGDGLAPELLPLVTRS